MSEPDDASAPPSRDAAAPTEAPVVADEDLALDPEVACDLLSEHGGNIVITDDGRIVFMNASAHLVELAHALDPDNQDVKARMDRIAEVRRATAAEGGAAEGGADAEPSAAADGGAALDARGDAPAR